MDLLSPWLLALLALIPIILGIYIWALRRKRRFAVRYSSISLIREALPRHARLRRHLPFALFLIGAAGLIMAATRPAVLVSIPLNRTTIILALDVSRSMCAVDVEPNRLTVAQDAALAFIDEQPAGTQIGIVAFAGLAEIIVPPTTDKDVLAEAIQSLTTSMGTAMGSATLKSIEAIAEINPEVVPSGVNLGGGGGTTDQGAPEDYQPEIIVVLTDGANTRGPLPLDAARQAADRNVRIYTIGFGTTEATNMVCTREQLGSDAFEGGNTLGFGGFGSLGGRGRFGDSDFQRFLFLDEPTLQAVADQTGGEYFRAENADQLVQVFLDLPSQIVLQKETLEISVLFVAFGGLLLLAAVYLSLRWNRYY